MASEVLYPIPKNCVVCREKFYVGMKIKRLQTTLLDIIIQMRKKELSYIWIKNFHMKLHYIL